MGTPPPASGRRDYPLSLKRFSLTAKCIDSYAQRCAPMPRQAGYRPLSPASGGRDFVPSGMVTGPAKRRHDWPRLMPPPIKNRKAGLRLLFIKASPLGGFFIAHEGAPLHLQPERHRAVVDQRHLHMRTEDAALHARVFPLHVGAEAGEHCFRCIRRHRRVEAGAVAFCGVGGEGELRDEQ